MILNQKTAQKFLKNHSIYKPQIIKIAGDASFRSYYRIIQESQPNLILMHAPPSHEDIKPFEKIEKILINNQFSAPKIFARDEINGFLLLEDLGDLSYSKALKENSEQELNLYQKACDCLIKLHQIKTPDSLPIYNNYLLFKEVMLFIDWYLPLKNKNINTKQKQEFKTYWFELFDLLEKDNQIMVLRDFHADNLMVLKNRSTFQQVGLLDFQDAVLGSNAYDLVSLLEDARRDVNPMNRKKLFHYFIENSKLNKQKFVKDYEIFSLQRNIKIIGIFARLAVRDNKKNYLDLIPRVMDFVKTRLSNNNPIFSKLGPLLEKFL